MARTALTIQKVEDEGLDPAYTAFGADGHSVRNSGREFLHVKNSSGYLRTLTLQTPQTVDALAVAERTISIPSGADGMFIGPLLPLNLYNQSDGSVYIDIDDETGVTIAALRLG
jgi:hypothetical protein